MDGLRSVETGSGVAASQCRRTARGCSVQDHEHQHAEQASNMGWHPGSAFRWGVSIARRGRQSDNTSTTPSADYRSPALHQVEETHP